jgi:hypothetical protein
VRLVTPLPLSVARPLIDGMKNQVIVDDPAARQMFDFTPMGYEDAVRLALKHVDTGKKKSMRPLPQMRLLPQKKDRRGCNLLYTVLFGSRK